MGGGRRRGAETRTLGTMPGLFLASSTKTDCDYLNGWIKKKKKKRVTYAEISPKMVHPRDMAGERRRRRRRRRRSFLINLTLDVLYHTMPHSPCRFEVKAVHSFQCFV